LAVEAIFSEGASGHRAEDPNETTAQRQARFEREYAALTEAKRNAPAVSSEWTRIQRRLGELATLLGTGSSRDRR
jgi:hypothetical protein